MDGNAVNRSDRTHVFIVGAPRSGTTWLQLLLSQHPAVATSQETHLFSAYLKFLERQWRFEERNPSSRKVGLRGLLSDQEFYSACRTFVDRIFDEIAATKKGANVVLEKTPNHVYEWELILKIVPEAYFIHIVRDPRSVVSSLRAAGGAWGKNWASAGAVGCALRWCTSVTEGRRIGKATDRYKEIRYEALLSDGPSCLRQIFSWLGLPADAETCRRAVETCAIDRLKKGRADHSSPWPLGSEPEGFFRKGERESWRKELPRSWIRTTEYLARDLMRELGYEPALRVSSRKPVRVSLYEGFEGLEWRVESSLRRLRSIF